MNQPQTMATPLKGTLASMPELNEGEIYIGAFINADGTGTHCILLPKEQEFEPDTWQNQMAKAALIGADLPTRAELVIMYEQFPSEFKKTWHWSNTTDRDGDQWAWFHTFGNGDQDYYDKTHELRARAVRRVLF
jgi:hypothetical protein